MIPPQRILHPTDFSPCAHGALAYALDLAAHFGAEMHVLHVEAGEPAHAREPDLMRPAEASLDIRLREMVNAQLGRFSQAVRDRLHIAYSLGHDGAAAPAITGYADAHRIDLVVMGTHGRRGLRRLILGSVAAEVLHECPCDVMTVRACDGRPAGWGGGRRILVAVDLAESSAQVLQKARELAQQMEAHLIALHVVEPLPLPVFDMGHGGTMEMLMPQLRQAARTRLNSLCEETSSPARPEIYIEEGPPAIVIVDTADEQDIDLIVMGARSTAGPKRLLLGSTTERVVRRASCPVWVLRAPAEDGLGARGHAAGEKQAAAAG